MEITLTKCPKDVKFKKSITVHAQGIDERVNINLETLCECDCEKDRLTVRFENIFWKAINPIILSGSILVFAKLSFEP